MPGRKCCVFNCKNNTLLNKKGGTRKSYFSFPRDEILRKKWLEFCQCKIDNIGNARICSDHFKDNDYSLSVKSDSNKKRLKSDAVPSQNRNGVETKESFIKKSTTSKSFIQENPRELTKKIIISSNSNNPKSTVKKKNVKKKSVNIHSQRKNGGETASNEITKTQIKRKITKSESNKENSKGIIKKKMGCTEIDIDLAKQKSMEVNVQEISDDAIDSNDNIKNVYGGVKQSIEEEEYVDEKINEKENSTILLKKNVNSEYIADDTTTSSVKLKMVTESWKTLPKKKKLEEEKDFEENNDTKLGSDNLKQALKRKRSPKKLFKKRIRLGKDESDSEDSPESENWHANNINKNGVRRIVACQSPSEMKDNIDLLNYLNYLKTQSRSSDQPILYWVDD